jgi:23S rRNA pseudouridine955/2504/2580 synthase
LLGKNPKSLRIINKAITNKEVTKTYHAIVKGHVKESLDLKAHLTKNQNRNRVTISSEGVGDYIHTLVKPIKVSEDKSYSLVEVTILTGKSHQIRAHLSSIGFPLIGDGKYGDKKTNNHFRKVNNIRYQMLHSYLYKIELDQSVLSCCNKEFIAPYFKEMESLITLLF